MSNNLAWNHFEFVISSRGSVDVQFTSSTIIMYSSDGMGNDCVIVWDLTWMKEGLDTLDHFNCQA